jgi:hypothetical protein
MLHLRKRTRKWRIDETAKIGASTKQRKMAHRQNSKKWRIDKTAHPPQT